MNKTYTNSLFATQLFQILTEGYISLHQKNMIDKQDVQLIAGLMRLLKKTIKL